MKQCKLKLEEITDQDCVFRASVMTSNKLAISDTPERICDDARSTFNPQAIEHMCQVWAEVGKAILARRHKIGQ